MNLRFLILFALTVACGCGKDASGNDVGMGDASIEDIGSPAIDLNSPRADAGTVLDAGDGQVDGQLDGGSADGGSIHIQPDPCIIEVDRDGDGTPEQVTRNWFNDQGQLLRTETDDDNDGAPDLIVEVEHSPNTAVRREDQLADGTVDVTTTTTFDSQDRIVRIESVKSDDTRNFLQEFVYAGDTTTFTEDSDGDGTTDTVREWTTTPTGRVTLEDNDADGAFDSRTEHDLDADGRDVEVRWDYDNDGTVDRILTTTYDAEGRFLRSEGKDGAGTVLSRIEVEYRPDGLTAVQNADSDNDGALDQISHLTFDADGWLLRRETDAGANGTIEQVFVHEYDAMHRPTFLGMDFDNDGAFDSTFRYVYDCDPS